MLKSIRYIAIAAIFVVVAIQLYSLNKKQPHEAVIGEATIGGHYTLTNQDGQKVSDTDFGDKLRLVFFGFTNCPSICPAAMAVITETMTGLGDDAAKVQPVFITVDPERDTVEQMKSYVSSFHPSIQALTGTKEEIEPVVKAYRVYSKKVTEGGAQGYGEHASHESGNAAKDQNYMMDHSSYIYLVDKDGKYLTHFTSEQPSSALIEGIKKYIK